MEIITNFIVAVIAFLFGGMAMPSEVAVDSLASSTAMVVRVVDGDTIEVRIDGQNEIVRYIGVDTPEPYRDGEPACYSQEATVRNIELVAGTQVQLVSDSEDRDKYDRLLRYVYVDEVFVNQQLVAEGYATALRIKPNTTKAQMLQAAEDQARAQDLGLWSSCRVGVAFDPEEVATPTPPTAIEINTTNLPAGQQQVLNAFGLNESNVTITPEVVACAEAAVGVDRVAAITGGDSPGVIEGIKLANCYRTN